MKSLVSIIIPTYNAEFVLPRALSSIFNQTYKNIEILIVDDCSSDNTVELLKEFESKQGERLKVFSTQKNSGGPATPRNIGLSHSKGEFVGFMDQDDFFLPNKIEDQVAFLVNNPSSYFVSGLCWVFDEVSGKIIDLSPGHTFGNPLFRKTAFDGVGSLDEKAMSVDDTLWFIEFFRNQKNMGERVDFNILQKPMMIYSRNRNQLTHFKKDSLETFFQRESIVISKLEKCPDLLRFFVDDYFRMGNYHCLKGNMALGRRYFKEILKDKLRMVPFVFYLLSFFGENVYSLLESLFRSLKFSFFGKLKVFKGILLFRSSYKEMKKIIQKYFHENSSNK